MGVSCRRGEFEGYGQNKGGGEPGHFYEGI